MQQQELSDDQQPRCLQHCDCSLERLRAKLKAKESQQRLEEHRLRAVNAVDRDMEMAVDESSHDLTVSRPQEGLPFPQPPPVGQIFVQQVRKLLVCVLPISMWQDGSRCRLRCEISDCRSHLTGLGAVWLL